MKKVIRSGLVLGLAIVLAFSAAACGDGSGGDGSDYPNKAIKFIVNYDVGGSTDLSMRALCTAAEKELGQTISVQNVSGGGGTAGIIQLMNSAPDGYTLGALTYAPMTLVPHQMELPYTPDSFDYILAHVNISYGIFVSAGSPYKTMDDMLAAAKDGKRVVFACPTITNQIPIIKLRDILGVDTLEYVTYESDSKAITAAMGGHVDAVCLPNTALEPFLQSNEMRMLACASGERYMGSPDTPTLIELGYDVTTESCYGVGAPAGLPEEVLEKLRSAFEKAYEDPDFQATMKNLNATIELKTGEEFKTFIQEGYDMNGEIIKALGL